MTTVVHASTSIPGREVKHIELPKSGAASDAFQRNGFLKRWEVRICALDRSGAAGDKSNGVMPEVRCAHSFPSCDTV